MNFCVVGIGLALINMHDPCIKLGNCMKIQKVKGMIAASLLILMPVLASAGTIPIVSGPGNEESCVLEAGSGSPGTSCMTQLIDVHPLWQPNNPVQTGYGGEWVSYADTGSPGSTLAPLGDTSPIMTLVETFTITTAGVIDFWIWADDTVDLYFNASGDPRICCTAPISARIFVRTARLAASPERAINSRRRWTPVPTASR